MPTDTSNNIKIHFRAEGEEELISAIQALSRATNTLKNSQMALAKSMGQTEKQREKAAKSGLFALRNQRNMNDAVSEGSMTFSVFRSKLLLASFALGLVGNSVGRLVRAFAEQEESEQRVIAALESTGYAAGLTAQEIFDMTSRLQEVGVVGDEVNNKLASFVLTFTNIRGEAFEKTLIAANNMAISISGTVPGFEQLRGAATMLAKALQDPQSQLGALSRAGFTFSDSQKKMVKELAENGNIIEAQNIILEAAEVQYGQLAEKLKSTTTGAFAALSNAASDASEVLGEYFAPGTVKTMNAMEDLFIAMKDNKETIFALLDTLKVLGVALLFVGGTSSAAVKIFTRLAGMFTKLKSSITATAAIFGTLGVGAFFKMQKSAYEAAEANTTLVDTQNGVVQLTGKELEKVGELTEALSKRTKTVKESNEDRKLQADITNAATKADFEAALQAKREILIKRELEKIDKNLQDVLLADIELLVDLTLEQDKNNFSIKQRTSALKASTKAQTDMNTLLSKAVDIEMDSQITLAKLAAFQKVQTKEQFDSEEQRIKQLETFGKLAKALGVESFDLSQAIKDGQTLATVSYDESNQAIIAALESVKLMINAEGELVAITERFGRVAESAFDKFMEKSQIATQALSGFSQAQSQLVEERMKREMEALKSSQEFEQATQEEREIMENRVEQRFKSARRRAFQIQKASNIAEATMNVAQAYTKALATLPPPGNIPLATFVAALGAAQVAAIAAQPAPRFATGGSFITSGPQNILVGESGAEKVTIQPLSGQSANQSSNNKQNIYINISAPLVDETIVDVIIPKIREAAKLNLA